MKKPLSEEPIDAFATSATIAMRDPIIAYSMTVTPDSSFAKLRGQFQNLAIGIRVRKLDLSSCGASVQDYGRGPKRPG